MGFSYTLSSFLLSILIFFSNTTYAQQSFFQQDFNLLSAAQNTVLVSPYDYPINNPFIATLSYVTIRPTNNVKYKVLDIDLHPERANIPEYGKNHVLNLAIFSHENNPTAPLIFIVPGIGSSTLTPGTLFLGEMLYNAGYNVVTLPSSLSWQFALSVSRSGLPGFSFNDAEDMLNLMKTADTLLRNKIHINPSKYALMGYSLGALDSSFIANLDLKKHFFNFERVLMLNPPIQKDKSISAIDRLTDAETMLTQDEKFNLLNFAPSKLLDGSIFSFDKIINWGNGLRLGLTDSQMAWLIGSNFRTSLSDVILLSQDIDDQGILKTPSGLLWRNLRKAESFSFKFRDYINQFLFAKLKDSQFATYNFEHPEDLIAITDMRSQLASLSENNVKWAIFHNQNDFIFHNGDLEFLFNSNSDSRIYPVGGHLGNLWFKQNRQDSLTFLAPLLNQ